MLVLVGLTGALGCSSAPTKTSNSASIATAQASNEPCWVKRPDCEAGADNTALYFVGMSEAPIANYGRPKRDSVHSAQTDAEQQYARYLGVEISSSIFLQTLLKDETYRSQFTHTLSSNVSRTVSDLIKVDEYFAAYKHTPEGEPMWTVYVLIKIDKQTAVKHQAAITEEAKRVANAPPPPAQWTASLFNIDDTAAILVNGTRVSQCEFSQSCTVKLSPHFKSGTNTVRLEYGNRFGFWTYGYEIFKDTEVMYEGKCGQVWVFGCSWDTSAGVIHTFEFEVEQP